MSERKIQHNGWRAYSLAEVTDLIGGGTPKTTVAEYWNGDIPWLSVTDFNTNRKFVSDSEKKITKEGLRNSSTKILEKGDIIISARGTVGVVATIGRPMAFNQSCYGVKAKVDLTINDFVYYLLKNTVANFLQKSHGGVFDTITKNTFKEIEVDLPPLPEQKAIAGVLSSLDDKIDLLHRQNKTLEDMAQTLFRKRFVEDAKEDWEEKPLDEIADYLNGLACQKYPPKNEIDKLPVLKIKELNRGISDSSDWATTDVDQKYIVKLGDVIFSWSGSLTLRIWSGQECILNQHLFKVTSEKFPKWFYYFWTKHHLEKFISIADSKATTMGHIKRGDLSSSLIKIPNRYELSKMHEIISPEFEKIILHYKQISNLECLRDTLLPKLMSGKARINFT